ncbi:MAG: DUF4157 domain-containing protein [Cyanobacteria bacterium P01_A01_bin.80]
MRTGKRKKQRDNLNSSVQFKLQQRPFAAKEESNDIAIAQSANVPELSAMSLNFGDIDLFPANRPATNKELLPQSTTISNPQDKEEKQADAIAGIAFNNFKNPQPQQKVQADAVQEEDEVQAKSALNIVTSEVQRDEEKEKPPEANATTGGEVSPQLKQDLDKTIQSGGQSIDPQIQAAMTQVTGNDYSNVQVHDNKATHDICARSNAKALNYKGNHILYGKNQNKPHTDDGKKLALHEMVHADQKGVTSSQGNSINKKEDVISRTTETPKTPEEQMAIDKPKIKDREKKFGGRDETSWIWNKDKTKREKKRNNENKEKNRQEVLVIQRIVRGSKLLKKINPNILNVFNENSKTTHPQVLENQIRFSDIVEIKGSKSKPKVNLNNILGNQSDNQSDNQTKETPMTVAIKDGKFFNLLCYMMSLEFATENTNYWLQMSNLNPRSVRQVLAVTDVCVNPGGGKGSKYAQHLPVPLNQSPYASDNSLEINIAGNERKAIIQIFNEMDSLKNKTKKSDMDKRILLTNLAQELYVRLSKEIDTVRNIALPNYRRAVAKDIFHYAIAEEAKFANSLAKLPGGMRKAQAMMSEDRED